MYVMDEMEFLQPNTRVAFILFGASMYNLGSMTGSWWILPQDND